MVVIVEKVRGLWDHQPVEASPRPRAPFAVAYGAYFLRTPGAEWEDRSQLIGLEVLDTPVLG